MSFAYSTPLTQLHRIIQQLAETPKWLTENDSLDSFVSSHGDLSLFISFITAAHTAKVIKGHSFSVRTVIFRKPFG